MNKLFALVSGACFFYIAFFFLAPNSILAADKESQLIDDTRDWVFPANGTVTDIFLTRGGSHKGIDIAGRRGTPVHAVHDGEVVKSYYSGTYGHVVMLRHSHGYETVYAHLLDRSVEEGQAVEKGDTIGRMGNTGQSSGVHLHFEIHKGEWTPDKRNVLDPFLVFESKRIGQQVAALDPSMGGSVHAASAPPTISPGTPKSDFLEVQPKEPQTSSQLVYNVQKGDTLWGISKMFGIEVKELKQLNGLTGDLILIGQGLIVKDA
ncbi:MAG TPA: peptidoglycan DD-metalloendopeptidase family protein [Bacillaceae bacterium]